MKNLKNKKKGFTLIELIIVIAIIAILAAVAIPKFGEVRANANKKADLANSKTIANAVASILTDNPSATVTGAVATGGEIEKYLQEIPKPKVKGTSFFVEVTNGNIVIKYDNATGDTIYPQP